MRFVRYAILAVSFAAALFCYWTANDLRRSFTDDAMWIMVAGLFATAVFIYVLANPVVPSDGERRPSVFRLLSLWMAAKEKDLERRARQ